jgi:hypothetical protein
MTKHIVFFIHGVGQHPAGWSKLPDGPVAALSASMANYPACFPAGRTFPDLVETVEIRYDDLFDLVLDTWLELGKSIPANSGFKWVDAVSDLMGSVKGNKDTFLRYGGDVLLYCGFDLVARAVRLRVNAVIATTIFRAWQDAAGDPGKVPRFAVVAHSLGTTVAQDALFQLATAQWDDDLDRAATQAPALAAKASGAAEAASFDNVVAGAQANPDRPIPVGLSALYLVSNTAPLLRQVDGDYTLLQNGGAFDCARVYNISHALDPVSRICGGAAIGQPRPGWTNITVEHLHQANIHGFGHYLSHPAVHAPMFARLADPDFTLTCAQAAGALAQSPVWRDIGGKLGALGDDARQALKDRLRALGEGESSVRRLRDAVEGLAREDEQ